MREKIIDIRKNNEIMEPIELELLIKNGRILGSSPIKIVNTEQPVKLLVGNENTDDNLDIEVIENPESSKVNYNTTIQLRTNENGTCEIHVSVNGTSDDFNNNDDVIDPNQEVTLQALTDYLDIPESAFNEAYASLIAYGGQQFWLPNNFIPTNISFSLKVDITDDEKRNLRNKGRNLPKDAPLGPTEAGDNKKPYSRPVPKGIKAPDHHSGGTISDPKKLLDKAKKDIQTAKDHKGPMKMGIPGFAVLGFPAPAKTIRHHDRKCTEYVYYFNKEYGYINDRTLILEEQISPSHEFTIANSKNVIKVTKTESGWSVSPSVSADVKGVSIGISGSYWETTTHIKGESTSEIRGRALWLFHVGRLYFVREAFVNILYEYHYEICDNGETRNWVETTITDVWRYHYIWEEELFVASRDDEGKFHLFDGFPDTKYTSSRLGGNKTSYEVKDLDPKNFKSPYGTSKEKGFFPKITKE